MLWRVEKAIAGSHVVQSVVLANQPHPDDVTVEKIRAATQPGEA